MAHRRNVGATLATLLVTTAFMIHEPAPRVGAVDQPCEVVPMPCTFEGLPFKLKVIDGQTGRPLADVHALAEWRMEGVGGRAGGPLMVKDALSKPGGELSFEGWGPIQGPGTGLVIGYDPFITIFKSGYNVLLSNNGYLPPARERERVRRFVRIDTTLALEPFRGTPDEWLNQLKRVWLGVAVPRNDHTTLKFRKEYLARMRKISMERDKFPLDLRRFEAFFSQVDQELKLLEEGQR